MLKQYWYVTAVQRQIKESSKWGFFKLFGLIINGFKFMKTSKKENSERSLQLI